MTTNPYKKVQLAHAQQVDAHYRRGAALVALIFPITVGTLLIAGLARNGLGSLATHPILVITLPTGLAAMLLWVKRYSRAAVTALRNRGKPIYVSGELIRFFSDTFPLTEASNLLVQGNRISLMNEDRVLAVEPTFFIKSDALGLNR